MTLQGHTLLWIAALLLAAGFVTLFKGVLFPFVLGAAVAYLLNPAVCRLEVWLKSRRLAVLLLLAAFFTAAVVLLGFTVPIVTREFFDLTAQIPHYAGKLLEAGAPLLADMREVTGAPSDMDLQAMIRDHAGAAANVLQNVFAGMMAGGQTVVGFVSLLFIMPIVAYFMMKEWPQICREVEDLMPVKHRDTIKGLLGDINHKLGGFVRGQLAVMLCLGVGYAVALSLLGLNYAVLIGLGAGLLSIIPMVGSAIGLLAALLVAWFQTGDWVFTLWVAGIFIAGQVIEGNFLTPKLVGDSVGLHPLWVFFAILAGGSVFGILGMLLAVPVAAVVSVLLIFAKRRYKASAAYQGDEKKEGKDNGAAGPSASA